MPHQVGSPVNRRTLWWALAFTVAGLVVALGWFPGVATAATGPRVGLAAALLMLGTLLGVGAFAGAIQARSTKLDAKGSCPVGAKCPCGHFNFKPRATCRQCGNATVYTS